MEKQTTLVMSDTDFYDQIAKDSKQALIQMISEAGHGKTSSLRTIIAYCREKHPDIVFKIFDVSQAWFHCAPVKYRQYVTMEKIEKSHIANLEDCVYEMGALPNEVKRAFVGTIVGMDYEKRYNIKLKITQGTEEERQKAQEEWDTIPTLVFIYEESNIYFGSYSFRKNDAYTPIFQNFVSVGRNYKMRGFLVATAEQGEIAPSLRRRSRRIFGRLVSEGDLSRIRRKDKELAAYLKEIPRYHFIYYTGEHTYGPVRVPDSVKHVPEDYVIEVQPQVNPVTQFDAGWWIKFGVGFGAGLLFLRFFHII